MSVKETKQWGRIGGFVSLSQSWSNPPDNWAFWPLYDKDSEYSETTYSGEDCSLMNMAPGFHPPDYGTQTPECLEFYEFSFQTGSPLAKLTVKRGSAKKKPEESCCRYLDWRIF